MYMHSKYIHDVTVLSMYIYVIGAVVNKQMGLCYFNHNQSMSNFTVLIEVIPLMAVTVILQIDLLDQLTKAFIMHFNGQCPYFEMIMPIVG